MNCLLHLVMKNSFIAVFFASNLLVTGSLKVINKGSENNKIQKSLIIEYINLDEY